jgi:[glutamine synthetase] adenylyltransferase / [glutamine synthetase]-adenylyl-L-tyrosine phosphorylase
MNHPTADHSRFVQRIRRRYPLELTLLPPSVPSVEGICVLINQLRAEGRSLCSAMRVARQLVLERLAVLDVEQGAALADITGVMTELAQVTLNLALTQAQSDNDARFGAPRNAVGERIEFWVIGMGKLGARELNVSSDIDLIYVYEESGVTDGGVTGVEGAGALQSISAHEYFAEVAKSLYSLVGETTEDGFVFRMDLALRPNGKSGPPAVSLAMLDDYLQLQGREWERFAWLKSRVVAPTHSIKSGRALALRDLVTAFVYRRYLDYSVFEGLRQLHAKVREEAQRRAVGRPERANDVKLGRGGIREIEFIVQLLLVARGGQFPEMRTRSTLKALTKLVQSGLMKPASAQRLGQAYEFLRRVEHRIQYLDDQQTHVLPLVEADLAWMAHSLNLPNSQALQAQLSATREFVAAEFDALLHDGRKSVRHAQLSTGHSAAHSAPLAVDSEAFLDQLPPELAHRLRPLCESPKIQLLHAQSKLRLATLIERAAHAVQTQACTMAAATCFVDWLEPLLRRESYLALLVERPEVQNRLLRLLGLARWPMRYLMLHPGVIDELADQRALHSRFDAQNFTQELNARHAAWVRSGQADEESLLDTLRRAHHAEVFRILVRDVEGDISVEQVSDELSALADATLALTLRWAWQHLKQAQLAKPHLTEPRFAVIAYGKLGGKELGYGSDLDVVFVYDDSDEANVNTDVNADVNADISAHAAAETANPTMEVSEIYAAFARKLIQWLTLRTAAGELFDVDTALRPNGSSGLLVTSITSFERYQTGRGSNTAWAWEHQALTRARWCAGWQGLEARFDAVRRSVLCAPRNAAALRLEILAMRDKLRHAQPVKPDHFDVKHSAGGMLDVEFAVQYLVLTQGCAHPSLMDGVGNIALLQRAESCGLLPALVGQAAADAYRALRHAQHCARLNEQPTQVAFDALGLQREAVLVLWRTVFAA